jgi:hypothetical protein
MSVSAGLLSAAFCPLVVATGSRPSIESNNSLAIRCFICELRLKTWKSHPRKWVDGSDPTYMGARTEFLNPTNGKLVDSSDPASETKRSSVLKSEFRFMAFCVDEQVGSEPSTNLREPE